MIPKRLLLLLAAGLVILGLVVFRERQLARWKDATPHERPAPRRLAPRFEVADHHRHVVKFERFLGRQRVVLIFFDAELGAAKDPRVQAILPCAAALAEKGIEVVAISGATPYANQQAEAALGHTFPFPLLTDIELKTPIDFPVHRRWGRFDVKRHRPLTGVFLIARDGTVPITPEGLPLPVADEEAAIAALCHGEWPRQDAS
jgi:peroxiredoxin